MLEDQLEPLYANIALITEDNACLRDYNEKYSLENPCQFGTLLKKPDGMTEFNELDPFGCGYDNISLRVDKNKNIVLEGYTFLQGEPDGELTGKPYVITPQEIRAYRLTRPYDITTDAHTFGACKFELDLADKTMEFILHTF